VHAGGMVCPLDVCDGVESVSRLRGAFWAHHFYIPLEDGCRSCAVFSGPILASAIVESEFAVFSDNWGESAAKGAECVFHCYAVPGEQLGHAQRFYRCLFLVVGSRPILVHGCPVAVIGKIEPWSLVNECFEGCEDLRLI
jgi:hypothetical protein